MLEKTLKELSRRWRQSPDYGWTCDQFKSLRQDLTVRSPFFSPSWMSDSVRQVQRIKNKFTVQVYEIHARMALESVRPSCFFPFMALFLSQKDLVEYNQCQAVLRDLYALGIEGSHFEFLAYRILYLCYTRDRTGELSPAPSTLCRLIDRWV